MRIIFVRHGEPDYDRDCLTEEGKKQAAAAAERLFRENISMIYTSPNGRARETASYTAALLGLPVIILDYMHEISWGGYQIAHNGHPWTLADLMMEEGFDFRNQDWRKHPYFDGNAASDYYQMISLQFDALLMEYGYRHENLRFLCETDTDQTIALFSHGGSGACVLAHLLNLPFPYVASVMQFDYTSLIVLNFPVREGEYVFPRLELFNDSAHIKKKSRRPILQQNC
ncbi:MAG: histidine phosphatase family protein [Blautia sp.]|nr:histidine phosphatase family protein [Blautia sp.]